MSFLAAWGNDKKKKEKKSYDWSFDSFCDLGDFEGADVDFEKIKDCIIFTS